MINYLIIDNIEKDDGTMSDDIEIWKEDYFEACEYCRTKTSYEGRMFAFSDEVDDEIWDETLYKEYLEEAYKKGMVNYLNFIWSWNVNEIEKCYAAFEKKQNKEKSTGDTSGSV